METIAGVNISDSQLVAEATELVRDASPPLLYHHSRRVYLFGMLQGLKRSLHPDPELLYVSAMFHDLGLTVLGLTDRYRTVNQRCEIDGADEACPFLKSNDIGETHSVAYGARLLFTPRRASRRSWNLK